MLFSGIVQAHRCTECRRHISHVIPTSVIPMLLVIFVATVCWTQVFTPFLTSRLLIFVIAVGLAIVLLFGLIALQQHINSRWQRNNACPDCGGKLEAAGGGFVDGATPGLSELLIYTMTMAVPAALWLLVERGG